MRNLILALALTVGGAACGAGYTTTTASVGVYSSARPRVVYADDYPGWLWVEGQYRYYGTRRVWQDGYWIQDRPGYVYAPGYYRPHSRVWVSGRWQSGGRDHSYYRAPRGHRVYKYPPPTRARSRHYRGY
jgi:hypothetical protein